MRFLFSVLGIGHAEVAHVVVAHVHAEKVSGGDGTSLAFGADALRIETGGFVIVPVHCVEIPMVKFRALRVGLGNLELHGRGWQLVEGGDVGEPP